MRSTECPSSFHFDDIQCTTLFTALDHDLIVTQLDHVVLIVFCVECLAQ